jgi:hypothetical protein
LAPRSSIEGTRSAHAGAGRADSCRERESISEDAKYTTVDGSEPEHPKELKEIRIDNDHIATIVVTQGHAEDTIRLAQEPDSIEIAKSSAKEVAEAILKLAGE